MKKKHTISGSDLHTIEISEVDAAGKYFNLRLIQSEFYDGGFTQKRVFSILLGFTNLVHFVFLARELGRIEAFGRADFGQVTVKFELDLTGLYVQVFDGEHLLRTVKFTKKDFTRFTQYIDQNLL